MNKNSVANLMMHIYQGQIITDESIDRFCEIFKELSDKEVAVMSLKYGLDDGVEISIDEVADTYEVTKEKIEEIIAGAFKKLRHPTRSKNLFKN